jgi:hypothetical protein
MTPFEQLEKNYRKFEIDREQYKQQSRTALALALTTLCEYLEVPKENFRFAPARPDVYSAGHCSSQGAAYLESDGWWSGSLLLEMSDAENDADKRTLKIVVRSFIKADSTDFMVGDSGEIFTVKNVTKESLLPFAKATVERMQGYLANGRQHFIDQLVDPPKRGIGFLQNI